MPQPPFPHINLVFKGHGEAKLEPSPGSNEKVEANKANRNAHFALLRGKAINLSATALKLRNERDAAGLPKIEGGIPFLVQIPKESDGAIEFIAEKLGLEIVAEYDDGFLIVASEDLDLKKFLQYAQDFAASKHGATGMASIIDIDEDPLSENRVKRILSDELQQMWPFPDGDMLELDVSIEVAAFGFPTKKRVGPKPEAIAKRDADFEADKRKLFERWDAKRMEREDEITDFVTRYSGQLGPMIDNSHIVEFPDSFSVRIKMSGQGFKDLIKNYPSLFEVTLPDHIQQSVGSATESGNTDDQFQLLAPDKGSPTICVIDSGIQEGHRWLDSAINKKASHCFIRGKAANDVADYVANGGHGTRVAGACLYPRNIPTSGTHKPSFSILNARVLDEKNGMMSDMFPPGILSEIIEKYRTEYGTRIYQHSVGTEVPCRLSRMSVWASMIDNASHKADVLVIQAAGNIKRTSQVVSRPGVLEHWSAGRYYPSYLYEGASAICNPAQSLQALTVGSVSEKAFSGEHQRSISSHDHGISAFSRSGFGMWDSIKPEVVEIGGDYIIDEGNPPSVTIGPDSSPQLIRATTTGGPPFSRDIVGTSFAAPKVAYIAGNLAALLPEHHTLLYRALIVNSARWPAWTEEALPAHRLNILKSIGYGLPDASRATENTPHRITLITDSIYEIKAGEGYIFGIPIPASLRPQGDSYRVRIDVTLSYVAEPRRTRKARRGYLGVWLDWRSSKKRELFDTFKARALKDSDGGDGIDDGNFRWRLGNRKENDGRLNGACRKNGTVQKDWTVTESYELPDTFGIVIRGHKGWDRNNKDATAKFALAVSFEAIGREVEIYEKIKVAVDQEVKVSQQAETEVVLPRTTRQ